MTLSAVLCRDKHDICKLMSAQFGHDLWPKEDGNTKIESGKLDQARSGLCATFPWHMSPYWDIKWALDNDCLISVFVNIQICLKQTIRGSTK